MQKNKPSGKVHLFTEVCLCNIGTRRYSSLEAEERIPTQRQRKPTLTGQMVCWVEMSEDKCLGLHTFKHTSWIQPSQTQKATSVPLCKRKKSTSKTYGDNMELWVWTMYGLHTVLCQCNTLLPCSRTILTSTTWKRAVRCCLVIPWFPQQSSTEFCSSFVFYDTTRFSAGHRLIY